MTAAKTPLTYPIEVPEPIMRFFVLWLTCVLSSTSACFAEVADKDQRIRWLNLQKLAIEARELNRCTGVIWVEDISAFEPITRAYFRKTDELAKAIEEFVSRYSNRRGKDETIPAFRYRVWDVTLQAGAEKARPV